MATNTWPGFTAGQRLTAATLNGALPLIVYKTVNTDRTSTTTFADDPELTCTLAASALYIVEFYLHYASGATGKIKTQWTAPSGATGNRSVRGAGSTQTTDDPISMRTGVHGYTTSVTYGYRSSGATNQMLATEESVVTTSAAGTCAIQWAQNAIDPTATRLAAGSWMRVTRVA